eukprot:scaffold6831_cov74-Phaeocystis_antarctica.AAC.2
MTAGAQLGHDQGWHFVNDRAAAQHAHAQTTQKRSQCCVSAATLSESSVRAAGAYVLSSGVAPHRSGCRRARTPARSATRTAATQPSTYPACGRLVASTHPSHCERRRVPWRNDS